MVYSYQSSTTNQCTNFMEIAQWLTPNGLFFSLLWRQIFKCDFLKLLDV